MKPSRDRLENNTLAENNPGAPAATLSAPVAGTNLRGF